MKNRFIVVMVVAMFALLGSVSSYAEYTMEQIEMAIIMTNGEMPKDADGFTMTSCSLDKSKKRMVYNFKVKPETGVTATFIRYMQNQLKDQLKESFINGAPEMKEIIESLKKNGYGMQFIFTDGDDDSVVFDYPSSEI